MRREGPESCLPIASKERARKWDEDKLKECADKLDEECRESRDLSLPSSLRPEKGSDADAESFCNGTEKHRSGVMGLLLAPLLHSGDAEWTGKSPPSFQDCFQDCGEAEAKGQRLFPLGDDR